MNNFFRALIAGYGAKKLGGGCLGTVIVFIVIWMALGQCSWRTVEDSVRKEGIENKWKVNQENWTPVSKPDALKSTEVVVLPQVQRSLQSVCEAEQI